jgi:hypothetical protein
MMICDGGAMELDVHLVIIRFGSRQISGGVAKICFVNDSRPEEQHRHRRVTK